MSDDRGMPRCVRCGYMLVGNPPPVRCPECGHKPRAHERWVEGELHREGPAVVLPMLLRHAVAAVAVLGPIALGSLLNPGTLKALEIPFSVDARWCQAAGGVGAVVAAFLWTRPLLSRDARHFALDGGAPLRPWIAVLQLPWLAYAALLVGGMFAPPAAKGAPPNDAVVMGWAGVMATVAQVPWILAMRHVANTADYLRDGRVRWSTNAWMWLWVGFLVVRLVGAPLQSRYGSGASLGESLLGALRMDPRLSLLWGGVNGSLVAWLLLNALTMAHEEVARDERRAESEASRYRVPD